MGNRGTTRSWDEEEIEKYGFDAHMNFTARHLRASLGQEKEKRVELHKKLVALLKTKLDSVGNCGICTKPITDEHPDEIRMMEGKPVHGDCYFEKLGQVVEQFPIFSPRQTRSV